MLYIIEIITMILMMDYTEDDSEITYMRLETDEEMGKRMLPLDKSEINQEN
jgi:hypothetical protein